MECSCHSNFLWNHFYLVWTSKLFGVSSAEGLLKATVVWLPFGTPEFWLVVIGWWEVAIGVTFLFSRTTKIAIALLFLQMFGTFMPLVLLPEVTFQNAVRLIFTPTLEGAIHYQECNDYFGSIGIRW